MKTLIVLSVVVSIYGAFSSVIGPITHTIATPEILRFLDLIPNRERQATACEQYEGMFKQCLPPTEWICDKPAGYHTLHALEIKNKLMTSSIEYANHLKGACIGNTEKKEPSKVYTKHPVCREVKQLIEYIAKPATGEVCQVVLNSEQINLQKIYRTECFNGDPSAKAEFRHRCSFDYGTFVNFYCKPTNFVSRKMLIHCPSTGLQFHTEKVATACSCVKVGCKA